jgi:hypothetical protein
MLDDIETGMLAALIWVRFGYDHTQARAAWSRMLQNYGWDDDAEGRAVFADYVAKGCRALRELGFQGFGN